MANSHHLEIYRDAYRLNRDLFRLKAKLPKSLRYDLGESLTLSGLKALRWIVFANSLADKTKALENLALELKYMMVLLRLNHDLQGLSHGEHQMLAETLNQIAEQNSKWLLWARRQSKKQPVEK